ncbi:MAG: Na+/H+ antiporter subunit B [Candidatus Rokubacteria bacterium]|nr:Na+/H+ antiporter subunit B [Candidatus Rokubacteria bacterium]
MTSLILQTATRLILPLAFLLSVFLLARGHNAPGGGFIGGLVAAAAFALYAMAAGVPAARRLLRIDPHPLIGAGLLLALGSGALALAADRPLMTGLWTDLTVPGLGALAVGTPLAFDLGVYLLVVGVMTMILLTLAED